MALRYCFEDLKFVGIEIPTHHTEYFEMFGKVKNKENGCLLSQ